MNPLLKKLQIQSQEKASMDVHNGVKKVVETIKKIKSMQMSEEFEDYLHSADPLTNAHPRKKNVVLEDVFVCPKLKKVDTTKQTKDEYEDDLIDGKILFESSVQHSKIIIMGADHFCVFYYGIYFWCWLSISVSNIVPWWRGCTLYYVYGWIKSFTKFDYVGI
ncbi:hypothetical protein SAMN05720781_1764 [Fibrobacter sp. UWT3]|uniref:hypothetical protein n=1 Tax=Fibrobacter sp. UWT3 TaxID=1896225 RepID=UPI000BD825D7|nr:hypothetical protein [Fibrobacter sp. UWT3]SOE75728.1 hypothetical protein SAMN05720781_1764 [Fibrobacter sp. UWT3]